MPPSMVSMGEPVPNLGAPRATCLIFFKLLCKLRDEILEVSVHDIPVHSAAVALRLKDCVGYPLLAHILFV
jgi:hypothetical protein